MKKLFWVLELVVLNAMAVGVGVIVVSIDGVNVISIVGVWVRIGVLAGVKVGFNVGLGLLAGILVGILVTETLVGIVIVG